MRAHVTYVAYDTRLGTKSCVTKIIEIGGITGNRSFSLFRTAKGFNLCKHARCVYPPTQVGSIFSKFRALTFNGFYRVNISVFLFFAWRKHGGGGKFIARWGEAFTILFFLFTLSLVRTEYNLFLRNKLPIRRNYVRKEGTFIRNYNLSDKNNTR